MNGTAKILEQVGAGLSRELVEREGGRRPEGMRDTTQSETVRAVRRQPQSFAPCRQVEQIHWVAPSYRSRIVGRGGLHRPRSLTGKRRPKAADHGCGGEISDCAGARTVSASRRRRISSPAVCLPNWVTSPTGRGSAREANPGGQPVGDRRAHWTCGPVWLVATPNTSRA